MDMDENPAGAPAWQAELDLIIAGARRRAFEWGVHDCCTFAAACWQARTGTAALAGLAWASEEQAAQLLASLGGLQAAVTSRLGEPVAPLLAALGDLVLAVDPHDPQQRQVLAVCVGSYHVAPGARCLSSLPLHSALCAWRA